MNKIKLYIYIYILVFSVHIGVTDEDAFDLFILQSNQFNKSFGVFTDVISQSKTMICDRKRNVIYSKSLNNFTSLNFFWTIDNETRIEYANFT